MSSITTTITIVALSVIAVSATIGMMMNRVRSGKGIGESINQFAVATVVLPVVAVLAISDVISMEITGTLLGAAIGFVANGRTNRIPKA